MRESLITSSVLIVIIALLRTLLKGKISLRFQYALWLLVALRLLIPVSFVHSPVSVLNAVEPVRGAISAVAPKMPAVPGAGGNTQSVQSGTSADGAATVPDADTPAVPGPKDPDHTALFPAVWLAGTAVMGVWFLLSDLRFRRKLGRSAKRLRGIDCPLAVCVTAAVPSPCLYGLFRPAIYLTPDCLGSENTLRHVLAHEETHYRHLDHIWSLVRCVCLAVYWFNPLVWLAAGLSRRDCEMACDEGAILRLGEAERLSYGRTLLSMVVPKSTPAELLCTATTMTSGKSGLKERVALIAKRPKAAVAAMVAVVLIAAVAVGCTFTGAKVSETPAPDVPIEEALTVLPDELKDSVVLTAREELKNIALLDGGELLMEAFYAEDYGTEMGGRLFEIARITPVQFEQSYQSWDMSGGASYIGRDENWYYVRYSPTDVNFSAEHQEGYMTANEGLLTWVEGVFAGYDDIKPIEEDSVYQAFKASVTYPGRHINVAYQRYFGLAGYEAMAEMTYTLVLSQPVKQGEGGIWCVDRWYDENANAYNWVRPYLEVTLAEYYADLQAQADKGEAGWALDPLQVSMDFTKVNLEQERPEGAYTLGEVYDEDTPSAGVSVKNTTSANDAVEARLETLAGSGDGTVLVGCDPGSLYLGKYAQMNGGKATNSYVISYDWAETPAQGRDLTPAGYEYSVTLYSKDMLRYFQFFEGSGVVRCHEEGGDTWYEVSPVVDGIGLEPVGTAARQWYDDAESANREEPGLGEYEPLYIEEAKATLLLPKSWAGNYVVEETPGTDGFYLAQKDFLAGEWGIREDGTEGPVPSSDGSFVGLIDFQIQKKEDYLATFETRGGHNGLWLGEKDGFYYLIWFPTSFSSGDTVDAQAKAELYNKLMGDIQVYPSDASAYFIFDA